MMNKYSTSINRGTTFFHQLIRRRSVNKYLKKLHYLITITYYFLYNNGNVQKKMRS